MNSRIDFGHREFSSVIDKAKGQEEFPLVLSERLPQDKIIAHVISKAAQATIGSVRKPLTEFQNCEKFGGQAFCRDTLLHFEYICDRMWR